MNEQVAQAPARIWVRFAMTGFHFWKGASQRRAYLAQLHRHTFNVKLELDVTHDDRQVEFHDLIEAAKLRFGAILDEAASEGLSCEAMARRLLSWVADCWPKASAAVEVDEDGEAGARVEITRA